MVASQFDRRSFRSKVVSIEGRFDRNQKSVRSKTRVSSIEEHLPSKSSILLNKIIFGWF